MAFAKPADRWIATHGASGLVLKRDQRDTSPHPGRYRSRFAASVAPADHHDIVSRHLGTLYRQPETPKG
jgi:hypothetical protein